MFGTSTGQGLQQNYRFEGTMLADGQGLAINLFFNAKQGNCNRFKRTIFESSPEGNYLLRIEGLGFETQQIQLGLYQMPKPVLHG